MHPRCGNSRKGRIEPAMKREQRFCRALNDGGPRRAHQLVRKGQFALGNAAFNFTTPNRDHRHAATNRQLGAEQGIARGEGRLAGELERGLRRHRGLKKMDELGGFSRRPAQLSGSGSPKVWRDRDPPVTDGSLQTCNRLNTKAPSGRPKAADVGRLISSPPHGIDTHVIARSNCLPDCTQHWPFHRPHGRCPQDMRWRRYLRLDRVAGDSR